MPRIVAPVEERRFRLVVDGRPTAAWTCTPDGLEALAAGWLLWRGLVARREDLLDLEPIGGDEGVGIAARLRDAAGDPRDPEAGEPGSVAAPSSPDGRRLRLPDAEEVAEAFRQLYAGAERYQRTGGLHVAGLWDGRAMAVVAEDVGRHNTVDKVIGRALLDGLPTADLGLVVSARISGDIASKAAAAGLAWVASRSVPTTLALEAAEPARLPIFARAAGRDARVFVPGAPATLGVIQAGGESRRYGSAKALAEVDGTPIVERVRRAVAVVAPEVALIANEPGLFEGLDLPTRPDARPGTGVLGGILSALLWARERGEEGVLSVACDMPFLSSPLLARLLGEAAEGGDVATPESEGRRGVEPLCAWYSIRCIEPIEAELARGDLHVIGFWDDVDVRRVPLDEVRTFGPPERLFLNVNTPEDRERAEALAAEAADG